MNPSRPRFPARRRAAGWVFNAVVITLTLLVLAAIIIPTSTGCRTPAPRSRDSSNLRQIGQACLIYASDHRDQFPQTDTVADFAAALARDGGLNDATVWVSFTEASHPANRSLSTVLTADRSGPTPEFLRARLAFTVVARGLHANLPPTTPIAWTRGLQPDGTWSKDSPYGGDGGHIVFLGGNVAFHHNLASSPLVRFDNPKLTTTDIHQALPPGALIAETTAPLANPARDPVCRLARKRAEK
jgi:hypothetical protein